MQNLDVKQKLEKKKPPNSNKQIIIRPSSDPVVFQENRENGFIHRLQGSIKVLKTSISLSPVFMGCFSSRFSAGCGGKLGQCV